MTGYWCIRDAKKQLLSKNSMHHKQWQNNTSAGAEAVVLLELMEILERKGRHISQGKTQIGFDNRIVHKKIVENIAKASIFAQDAGAEIAQIKSLKDKIKFEIELLLVRGHEKIVSPYSSAPLKHLIKECDENAKKIRTLTHEKPGVHNIKFLGSFAITQDGVVINRSIKEAIRIIDARKSEIECAKEKFGLKANFIDINAREAFKTKSVPASMLKCASGHNHYGVRNQMINNNMVGSECPRCSEPETWDHVITCHHTKKYRKKFVEDLLAELIKEKSPLMETDEILDMIEDMLIYLDKDDEEDYETNQHLIGMSNLFRGFIIKVWKDVNLNSYDSEKCKKVNKIVIRHCVMHYKLCWDDRNEALHDDGMQRQRAMQWCNKVKKHVEHNKPRSVKLFADRTDVKIDQSRTETILQWICNVKTMMRKVEKIPQDDMRRFFSLREH